MRKERSWVNSFLWAADGLRYAVATQRNMKVHLLAAILVFSAGLWFGFTRFEWGMVMGAIFLVFITEVINTSIEKAIDLITMDYHPLARVAKNIAAGAVLLAAVYALIIAYLIIWPYLQGVLFQGG